MPVRKHKSSISFAKRVVKSDTKVVIQHTLDLEDEFNSIYEVSKSNAAMQPPFNPLVLKRLCTRNNILMQCVHAMETNIDGTGFEIADEDQDKDDRLPQPAPALENSPVDFNAIADPTVRAAAAAALVTADRDKQPQLSVVKAVGPAVVGAASAAAAIQQRKITDGIDPPSQFPLQDPPALPPAITPADPNAETPEDMIEKAMLKAFFKEPFPNESFMGMRRKLRVDVEATGNGYLEVIRNMSGEVVFLRHLDASTMRLVKLDNPVLVTRTIERNGETFEADIWVRERRFVQRVGTNYIYYKEFGSERKLDRENGTWLEGASGQTGFPQTNPGAPYGAARDSTPLLSLKGELDRQRMMDNGVAPGPASNRPPNLTNEDGSQRVNMASEVLHFICDKDATTPYGIPRWINNLPAVLGSRKAEEFNLEFFDAGGLPPAIIFIQGGALASSVKDQLLSYLGGDPTHRAAVVEAQSSSGSLDSAGQVKVTVERFGDNRANGTDSMFQTYDQKCEDHVRGAFRMPSIFLGKATDYNFATALTAVMVTEAQVFSPERKEFDEKINHTIVRALGAKRYRFKSLPITLKNVDIQLKSLALIMDKVSGPDLIDTINQITGLSLVYDEATSAQAQQQEMMQSQAKGAMLNGGDPFNSMQPQAKGKKNPFAAGLGAASGSGGAGSSLGSGMSLTKADLTSNDIVNLVTDWAVAVGLADGPPMEKELRRAVVQKVEGLPPEQRKLFNAVLATSTFTGSAHDTEGLTELAGCCVGLMAN